MSGAQRKEKEVQEEMKMVNLKNKQSALPETKKKRLPFSVYLAYLLVCTFLVSGASFAKLTTTSGGNDTARAAAFAVSGSVSTQEGTLDLNGENLASEYAFTVTNQSNGKVSEVALDYTIRVKLKNEAQLPNGVSMKLVDGAGILYDATQNENTYVFDEKFTLPAGLQETDSYRLRFSTEQGTQIGSDTSISMDITAVVEQRD